MKYSDTDHAERTGVIQGAAKRPDILVDVPGRQSVIVETEFEPARTAEKDATDVTDGAVSDGTRTAEGPGGVT